MFDQRASGARSFRPRTLNSSKTWKRRKLEQKVVAPLPKAVAVPAYKPKTKDSGKVVAPLPKAVAVPSYKPKGKTGGMENFYANSNLETANDR